MLTKSEQWLCTACFAMLPQTGYHQQLENSMAQKFYGRIPFRYAMALGRFRSGNQVQALIHQCKYYNQPKIGQDLGKYYGALLAQVHWASPFQAIVPVPLHAYKLRQRGYNQSDYFAKGLASSLGIPVYTQSLQRTKHTVSQTAQTKLARLQHLDNAFCVVDKQFANDQHILLVDDVLTTGATLEACALALLAAGVQEISIATMCIAE